MNTCKICDRDVKSDFFNTDYGICLSCATILESKVKSLQEVLPSYQEKANSADNANDKILYLKLMLDELYEYKIRYYDNDVDVLEQDIEDLIDTVIDCIADART